MKIRVGVDLDEVLAKFVSSLLSYYNHLSGKNISMEDIKSYNLWENGVGKSGEETIKIVDDFFESREYDKIEPIDGAIESIRELSEKYDLFIITSRDKKTEGKTRRFLQEHFNGTRLELIFSGDFHNEQGKSKAEICKELGIEYLIEDNYKYAENAASQGIKTFLFTRRWNRDLLNGRSTRVNDWGQIMEHFRDEQ
jgi:5'(3')-deoxyribonucleotidase